MAKTTTNTTSTRPDHKTICELIPKNSKVLDLGCGNGELLHILEKYKNINGSGIEISPNGVKNSISKGLSVIQGNLEEIIKNYPDNSFDYCILSQTLQELRNPSFVLKEMLRVGKNSLIAFYNLANIKYRLQILFKGRFPQSKDLPYNWLKTNVMFLSIKDFEVFCSQNSVDIKDKIFLAGSKKVKHWSNLRSQLCIFRVTNINNDL